MAWWPGSPECQQKPDARKCKLRGHDLIRNGREADRWARAGGARNASDAKPDKSDRMRCGAGRRNERESWRPGRGARPGGEQKRNSGMEANAKRKQAAEPGGRRVKQRSWSVSRQKCDNAETGRRSRAEVAWGRMPEMRCDAKTKAKRKWSWKRLGIKAFRRWVTGAE